MALHEGMLCTIKHSESMGWWVAMCKGNTISRQDHSRNLYTHNDKGGEQREALGGFRDQISFLTDSGWRDSNHVFMAGKRC